MASYSVNAGASSRMAWKLSGGAVQPASISLHDRMGSLRN